MQENCPSSKTLYLNNIIVSRQEKSIWHGSKKMKDILYNQNMPHSDSAQGFVEIPHRADVAIRVWATDLSGLFVQSACGLYSLMGVQNSIEHFQPRIIELNESDYESLLIRFLNELILDVQLRTIVYEEMTIQINQYHLCAELKGNRVSGFSRDVKAATYHDCRILKTASGYETMIVFDI